MEHRQDILQYINEDSINIDDILDLKLLDDDLSVINSQEIEEEGYLRLSNDIYYACKKGDLEVYNLLSRYASFSDFEHCMEVASDLEIVKDLIENKMLKSHTASVIFTRRSTEKKIL